MLEEYLASRTNEKRVRLAIRRPGLKNFLEVLLREWHFCPDDKSDVGLLLAEEGAIEAASGQQAIRLGSAADAARGHLEFPLELTDLYTLLQRYLHRPPRRHLRLALDNPCEISLAGRSENSRLDSLSERGCRLVYPAEIVRDIAVELRFNLGDMQLNPTAKVIYCIPRYQGDDASCYNLGLLITDSNPKQQARLRDYIVANYFLKVKQQLPAADFAEALGCFAISEGVGNYLVDPPLGR